MTPNQLHAIERVIKEAEQHCREYGDDPGTDKNILAARAALAYAWREYRAAQAEKRASAPRRMLQRVGVK